MAAFQSWLTHSLTRVTPRTLPPARAGAMSLLVARGERVSCQLAVRMPPAEKPVEVTVACEASGGIGVRVRRVGYVPVGHFNLPTIAGHSEGDLPGYVGDVLWEESAGLFWPEETNAFWLSLHIPAGIRPGRHELDVTVSAGAQTRRHRLTVQVAPLQLRPRKDFAVTNWFYVDALMDYYHLEPWSKPLWAMLEKYIANVVAHGQDTLYVPVFTPPLDGVKRPTQLLKVTRDGAKYAFDFADVRRYIRLAKKCGVRHMELNHLFTQWGVKHALRIYHGQGEGERPLWPDETPATGTVYRNFLAQYLPALRQVLRREGVLEDCFFHLSDEPHADHRPNYAAARGLLRELAPWMKVMDALSDLEFAREGLVDMPVPSISKALDFVRAGVECWSYYCCGPRGRYVQRLMDTPLAKIRMNGWLLYRAGVKGFLHWGYNYWYRCGTRRMIDPFTVSDGLAGHRGWAFGDPFMVYPGQDGPLDSVRWEVFAESLQDYALLESAGIDREAALLQPLRAYDDFPFDPAWILKARKAVLTRK